jgi:hypothetical protein
MNLEFQNFDIYIRTEDGSAMFAETLDNSQHSTWHIPESRSFT